MPLLYQKGKANAKRKRDKIISQRLDWITSPLRECGCGEEKLLVC